MMGNIKESKVWRWNCHYEDEDGCGEADFSFFIFFYGDVLYRWLNAGCSEWLNNNWPFPWNLFFGIQSRKILWPRKQDKSAKSIPCDLLTPHPGCIVHFRSGDHRWCDRKWPLLWMWGGFCELLNIYQHSSGDARHGARVFPPSKSELLCLCPETDLQPCQKSLSKTPTGRKADTHYSLPHGYFMTSPASTTLVLYDIICQHKCSRNRAFSENTQHQQIFL